MDESKILRAKKALETGEVHEAVADYFRAIVNNTLPKYYLEQLLERRSYSDELPEPTVSPDHPDYRFERLAIRESHPEPHKLKCRANVLIGISMLLSASVEDAVVDGEEALKAINECRAHKWNFEKGKKGEYWTSAEEIQLINRTLDTVINYIKDTYRL